MKVGVMEEPWEWAGQKGKERRVGSYILRKTYNMVHGATSNIRCGRIKRTLL